MFLGGSIAGLLRRLGAFQVGVVVAYTKHILAGLKYLHSKGIAHRDVKGANLLLTKTGTVKLADFGTATTALQLLTPRSRRHHVGDSFSKFLLESAMGTPHWMAPEVARGMGSSLREKIVWEKADIWSLGCTVVEMLTGHAPWYQKFSNPIAIIVHLAKNASPPEYPEGLSDVGCHFLDLCFQREMAGRPTVNQLLKQPFVRDRKAQIFPPSKLQVMSPIYMQRKTQRKANVRSLLDKETAPSLPGFSSPGSSSPARGNSKSSADLAKEKSAKHTLTGEARTITEKTPLVINDSRHDTLTQSNTTTTHAAEMHMETATKNDIEKQKAAADSDKVSMAANASTATAAAESITGTSGVNKQAGELNADLSETADVSAVNFQEDLVQLNTYPDAWQTKHAAEIEEIFDGTFRQWLFGHLKWVCKQVRCFCWNFGCCVSWKAVAVFHERLIDIINLYQAISHYLMTEEQSDYLLEDQYAGDFNQLLPFSNYFVVSIELPSWFIQSMHTFIVVCSYYRMGSS